MIALTANWGNWHPTGLEPGLGLDSASYVLRLDHFYINVGLRNLPASSWGAPTGGRWPFTKSFFFSSDHLFLFKQLLWQHCDIRRDKGSDLNRK